jgi:inorganic pyrophosphatase
MSNLANVPTRDVHGHLRAIIETPRGSRIKIEFDEDLECFAFKRPLALGISYPYGWGFFPSTRASDGDPLDVMVYHEMSTYPGVAVSCRAIGVVELSQKAKGRRRQRNDRVIVVPFDEPRYDDVRDLDPRVRDELEQFFVSAVLFEHKGVRVEGWAGPKTAEKLIRQAQRTYDAGGQAT